MGKDHLWKHTRSSKASTVPGRSMRSRCIDAVSQTMGSQGSQNNEPPADPGEFSLLENVSAALCLLATKCSKIQV